MSLTPVQSRAFSVDGSRGEERRESIHRGKRRVSVLLAALCLLLAWERARHLPIPLARGSGDHAAVVATLGNALLLGVCAYVAAAAIMCIALGLPRLIVTRQGLMRRSLFHTATVGWDSLSRFHVERLDGGRTVRAAADVIGPNASPRLRRRKDRLFKIRATYRTPVETIVAEIHGRQTEALGAPAPLPRAASAPVVPEYGIAGFRMPWATFGLLAVLALIFLAEHRLGVLPEDAPLTPNVLTLYAFGSVNQYAVLHHGEVLRLLSSALLHFNALHLIGNAVALLLVGWPVERLAGRSWFLAIFIASSLAGSVVGLAAYPAHMTLAGASGGMSGLFAAMAVLSFRFPAGRRRVFMLVRTTLVAIVIFTPAGPQDGFDVGHAVHLGGALAGAALGVLLLRTWGQSRRLPGFREAGLAVGALGLALALLGIPASLRLSRDFIASIQGCASSDPDRNIRGCTAMLDSNPGVATGALLSRSRAYAATGQYDLAIVDLDRTIALVPGSADAFLLRGDIYLNQEMYDGAIADYTEALRLRPSSAAAYNNRAWALHLDGEDAAALPDAEKAVTLAPSSAASLETRAEIYEKLGRKRDAIADYRAALAIDGSQHLARDGLRRLSAGFKRPP